MASSSTISSPVLHVIVIGFHHKKGCQVEYSYPPLIEGNAVDSNEVPQVWKHLPSLAIPDGAHNYLEDTIFFHLPARGEKVETVYGVSCYRQMDATELRNRGSDVTRNSVQKSVCVLSRLPLYGLIQAKLELITHAYFDERDFSQVALIEETFKNLNASLNLSLLEGSQVFLGLSARDIVQRFRHRILVLFKLMLLERRVLFFGSPVKPICTAMLAMLSLFPRMIEYGLQESASYSPTRQLSPTLKVTRLNSFSDDGNEYLEVRYSDKPYSTDIESAEKLQESTKHLGSPEKNSSPQVSPIDKPSASTKKNKKPRMSPGHPVQVSDVKERSASVDQKKHDFPGIHRQSSKESQGSTTDAMDHPLSSSSSHRKSSDNSPKSRSRNSSGSRTDEIRERIERGFEYATTAIDRITHVEKIQESLDESSGNQVHTPTKKDALDFVHEITKVSSVQKHIQRLSSSGRSTSLPDEDLTPDEKELLGDTDDCAFSWQEDRLLLEINEDVSSPDSSDTALADKTTIAGSLSNGEKAQDDSPEWDLDRAHNPELEADLFSLDSQGNKDQDQKVHKPKNAAKTKQSVSLRDKLSAALSNNKDNELNVELTEIRPITPSNVNVDEFGFPSSIFTKGMLCHPYLSLQFYDLLQDVNVRGFAIGATNILFKQKRHLLDAIVEVNDEGKIEIHDAELRKQVNLTTADLRFADYLVKATTTEGEGDLYLDDTSWEGGDEWLRAQFRHYMLSLLAASIASDEKAEEDFNVGFMAAWRTTHNYKLWHSTRHRGMVDMSPTHPYHGQVTMADMRLKLAHTLSGSERGKKVNAAMTTTGKAVLQTGKVVGGAITSARSAVSSWFSSWREPKTDASTEIASQLPTAESNDDFNDLSKDLLAGSAITESSSEEVFVQEPPGSEQPHSPAPLKSDLCNGESPVKTDESSHIKSPEEEVFSTEKLKTEEIERS